MIYISYDPGPLRLVKFFGLGGFTQIQAPLHSARAIATVLGVELVVCKPGTDIPCEDQAS